MLAPPPRPAPPRPAPPRPHPRPPSSLPGTLLRDCVHGFPSRVGPAQASRALRGGGGALSGVDGGVDGNADAPTVTGPLPVAPAWAPPTWIPPTADYGAVPPSATAPVKKSAWTAGTIVALCLGSVLGLLSVGTLGVGGGIVWLDHRWHRRSGWRTDAGVAGLCSSAHAGQ